MEFRYHENRVAFIFKSKFAFGGTKPDVFSGIDAVVKLQGYYPPPHMNMIPLLSRLTVPEFAVV